MACLRVLYFCCLRRTPANSSGFVPCLNLQESALSRHGTPTKCSLRFQNLAAAAQALLSWDQPVCLRVVQLDQVLVQLPGKGFHTGSPTVYSGELHAVLPSLSGHLALAGSQVATARLAALLPGAASWLTSLQLGDGHKRLSREQITLIAELVTLLVPRLHSQGGPCTLHSYAVAHGVSCGLRSPAGNLKPADEQMLS